MLNQEDPWLCSKRSSLNSNKEQGQGEGGQRSENFDQHPREETPSAGPLLTKTSNGQTALWILD